MREACAQVGCEVRHLFLLRAERVSDRLARQVVGRAAEAAGDEQEVDERRLAAHELGDDLDLVRERRDQPDGDAERREPPREPGAVRVRNVTRDELVADGEDRRGGHQPFTIRTIGVPATRSTTVTPP